MAGAVDSIPGTIITMPVDGLLECVRHETDENGGAF